MRRKTVSLSESAALAIDRIARLHKTNASCVVEAAGALLAEGGPGADALRRRIVAARRGGRRDGAGRKHTAPG